MKTPKPCSGTGLVRVNLWLLAGVGLLGLALWWWPDPQTARGVLTPLDPQRLTRIRLSDRGGLKLVLARELDGWRILQPRPGPADGERVQSLIELARAISYRSFPTRDGDLPAWGLTSPRYWLELDEVRLVIGAEEPLRRRRYVQVGDRVHLIDDGLIAPVMAAAEFFLAAPLRAEP